MTLRQGLICWAMWIATGVEGTKYAGRPLAPLMPRGAPGRYLSRYARSNDA